jgi:hypothetical protein
VRAAAVNNQGPQYAVPGLFGLQESIVALVALSSESKRHADLTPKSNPRTQIPHLAHKT